jgi:ribosome-associated protein
MSDDLIVAARVRIPETDLSWSAVRASGPGGQHVNRTASKVQLRFDLPGTTALTDTVKTRLRKLAEGKLDADGWILVVSQDTRGQHQNLEDARQKLAAMIRAALVVPKKRRKTKPSRGSVARRLDAKHQRSDKKKNRQKVRDE